MANAYNQDWENILDNNNFGPRVPFMKLQSGKNICRVASKPSKVVQHWEKTVDGNLRKITCIGEDCPICKAGHAPSVRYQIKVIDKMDPDAPEAKVLEIGASILRNIVGFVQDDDYGDPTKYDLKIQKTGTGRDTRYSVTASPHKNSITEEEKKLLAEIPSIEEINKPLSVEQIYNMNLECLANSSTDDFGTPSSSSSSSSASKPASSKSSAVDDWESL